MSAGGTSSQLRSNGKTEAYPELEGFTSTAFDNSNNRDNNR